MQSSLIGKIEKAKRYARELDRITFTELSVNFRGENDTHVTGYGADGWHCSCDFFSHWDLCSHTMTLEKVLGNMLPGEALSAQFDTGAVNQ
ncbi:MAG: hypothetical protein PHE15_02480 [Dehalococcoidales bacterium]|jgi:hypothetical protein|nr:hypothetical protein [Dehalococcoidales bacterium]